MTPLAVIGAILNFLFLVFFFAMWARFILDLVRAFRHDWKPRGFGLVIAESSYTITDPPIKFVRRILPPLSLGPVALDFGWSITMIVVIIGIYTTSRLG